MSFARPFSPEEAKNLLILSSEMLAVFCLRVTEAGETTHRLLWPRRERLSPQAERLPLSSHGLPALLRYSRNPKRGEAVGSRRSCGRQRVQERLAHMTRRFRLVALSDFS